MGDRIRSVLSTVLERDRPVALVNFPNHANPGDNAIWLGTCNLLEELRVPVGYASTWSAFSERAMRRAIGDGPLLL
ncbi:MAG: exopolysaccharide biosynthesis protein, partial [Candidatus Eremiobacteraeota bacterium]|nr:exopolysaccharide biosynthesis protein [Candidatus Eremiobacteraeota bacterium]